MSNFRRRTWRVGLFIAACHLVGFYWWCNRNDDDLSDPRQAVVKSGPTGTRRAAAPAPAASPGPAPASDQPIRLVSATVEEIASDTIGGFSGRVIDWGSGLGVANADVTFAFAGATTTVVSGGDGEFAFAPSELGSYSLAVVTADGYLPYAPELGDSIIELVARRGLAIRGVTIYITPAIAYRARVLDPEGQPVAGATVRLLGAASGDRALHPIADTFTTGDDGVATFSAPDFATLEASHGDFAAGYASLDGAAQVSHELTIVLRRKGAPARGGGVIAGRVVDERDQPVADVRLATPGRAPMARSDADGRFEITSFHGDRVTLVGLHDDYAPGNVIANRGQRDVILRLVAGAVITGKVMSSAGEPVPAFTVVVLHRDGPMSRTVMARKSFFDARGEFTVGGLPTDTHVAVALASGFAPSPEATVEATTLDRARPVTLTLPGGGRIAGKVIDRATGAALARARISLEGRLGQGSSAVPLATSVVTDDDGTFLLSGVAPGLRSINVAAYAHHIRIISNLEVVDGGEVGPITVDLAATEDGEKPRLELAGIGVVIAAQDDGLYIRQVIPEGGAAAAGLGAGDTIIGVEGIAVTELGFEGALQRIRGPEGSAVTLTIRRAEGSVVDMIVYRRRIRV